MPLLTGRGLSVSTAAIALGLGGVGQVLGRLGYARLVPQTSVRLRTVLVILIAAVTTALLAALPGPMLLLVAAAMLAGMARGMFTLLQATAISDRWGTANYGRLNGLFSAPMALTGALAPWAGTSLAAVLGGYPAVFATLAVVATFAALLAAGSTSASRV